MANTDLLRSPKDVKVDGLGAAWFYEDSHGLTIVHRIHDGSDKFMRTDQIKIPWRSIRAALKRKDK